MDEDNEAGTVDKTLRPAVADHDNAEKQVVEKSIPDTWFASSAASKLKKQLPCHGKRLVVGQLSKARIELHCQLMPTNLLKEGFGTLRVLQVLAAHKHETTKNTTPAVLCVHTRKCKVGPKESNFVGDCHELWIVSACSSEISGVHSHLVPSLEHARATLGSLVYQLPEKTADCPLKVWMLCWQLLVEFPQLMQAADGLPCSATADQARSMLCPENKPAGCRLRMVYMPSLQGIARTSFVNMFKACSSGLTPWQGIKLPIPKDHARLGPEGTYCRLFTAGVKAPQLHFAGSAKNIVAWLRAHVSNARSPNSASECVQACLTAFDLPSDAAGSRKSASAQHTLTSHFAGASTASYGGAAAALAKAPGTTKADRATKAVGAASLRQPAATAPRAHAKGKQRTSQAKRASQAERARWLEEEADCTDKDNDDESDGDGEEDETDALFIAPDGDEDSMSDGGMSNSSLSSCGDNLDDVDRAYVCKAKADGKRRRQSAAQGGEDDVESSGRSKRGCSSSSGLGGRTPRKQIVVSDDDDDDDDDESDDEEDESEEESEDESEEEDEASGRAGEAGDADSDDDEDSIEEEGEETDLSGVEDMQGAAERGTTRPARQKSARGAAKRRASDRKKSVIDACNEMRTFLERKAPALCSADEIARLHDLRQTCLLSAMRPKQPRGQSACREQPECMSQMLIAVLRATDCDRAAASGEDHWHHNCQAVGKFWAAHLDAQHEGASAVLDLDAELSALTDTAREMEKKMSILKAAFTTGLQHQTEAISDASAEAF